MDSMKKLQGSLPISSRRRNAVLAPFRETACSLTAFFKIASAEIDRAYDDGARSALEQLLSVMDNESLGLQDGQGWRVRQLVMNIYEGLQPEATTEDDCEHLVHDIPVPEAACSPSSPASAAQKEEIASSEAPTSTRAKHPRFEDATSVQMPMPEVQFTFATAPSSEQFRFQKTPNSPSDATRTPPLRTTNTDGWNFSGLNIFAQPKNQSSASPIQASGLKRRSKSPSDSSEPNAPSTPKRLRRHEPARR